MSTPNVAMEKGRRQVSPNMHKSVRVLEAARWLQSRMVGGKLQSDDERAATIAQGILRVVHHRATVTKNNMEQFASLRRCSALSSPKATEPKGLSSDRGTLEGTASEGPCDQVSPSGHQMIPAICFDLTMFMRSRRPSRRRMSVSLPPRRAQVTHSKPCS